MSVNHDYDRKYLRSIRGISKIVCLVSNSPATPTSTAIAGNTLIIFFFFFFTTHSAVRLHWFPLHRVQLGAAEQLSRLLLHNRRSPWLRCDADAAALPLPAARSELAMELGVMVAGRARDPGHRPFPCL